MQGVVDLSLVMTDNMPAHKLFQSPIILPALSHEQTKAFGLGLPEDRMTFATTYLGMLDHVGTHVDALYHTNPSGASVDEMTLDMFFGKAVCFDLTHIPDLGVIDVEDLEAAEEKCGVAVDGHIVLLNTGLHDLLRLSAAFEVAQPWAHLTPDLPVELGPAGSRTETP